GPVGSEEVPLAEFRQATFLGGQAEAPEVLEVVVLLVARREPVQRGPEVVGELRPVTRLDVNPTRAAGLGERATALATQDEELLPLVLHLHRDHERHEHLSSDTVVVVRPEVRVCPFALEVLQVELTLPLAFAHPSLKNMSLAWFHSTPECALAT